ncbi:hypothetical protein HKCCE2091_06680 [Rhodobacterales bacterium HKCCE2091]|nr:hypothetical protein [Rhodobacterales bacterium HKCCE2091]
MGAIADDLTGATDLALTLARGGMRVRQVVGVPDASTDLAGTDAVIVSLKSRTIPAAEAVAQSEASAKALLAAGTHQLFFKYCSTFDSTDEGNIGPVIAALMALTGEDRTIACPAFPANGRTVYRGHLFVGNALLSESGMRNHPLTPMTDSNLPRLLRRQTDVPVSLIDISTVRTGSGAIREALKSTRGIAVIDAIEDTDLMTIGAAARGLKLVTGGSGVALGLPGNFPLDPAGASDTAAVPSGRAAVLAGSCSEATIRQVSAGLAGGMPGFRVDPYDLAAGRTTPEHAIAFATDAPGDRPPLIYASADPASVRDSQEAFGREAAGAMIEEFLGRVAIGLAARGFDRMVIAGGETSGAIIAALGVTELDVGPEIDPGVPWMIANRGGNPVALALKSGNFGANDIFLSAWGKLR